MIDKSFLGMLQLSDCSKRTNQEATDGLGKLESDHGPLGFTDILSDYKPYRKDTGPSSSSSGVSSASPLSHSPAASHSSSSSLSPRGSPVTWQSGSDGDLILRGLFSSSSDSNNLPPPPTIWSSSQSNRMVMSLIGAELYGVPDNYWDPFVE